MPAWMNDELNKIGDVDEIQVAPLSSICYPDGDRRGAFDNMQTGAIGFIIQPLPDT